MIYIYTGNHNSNLGIEDIVSLLGIILNRHDIEFEKSNYIVSGKVNIVIDEFANKRFIDLIVDEVEGKNTKIICVLTEFVTKKFLIKNFNLFGGFSSFVVSIYARLFYKLFKNRRVVIGFGTYLYSFILSPIFIFTVVSHYFHKLFLGRRKSFRKIYRDPIYFTFRYLGLLDVSAHISFFLKVHPSISIEHIAPTKPCFFITPQDIDISYLMKSIFGKNFGIFVSGTITQNRINAANCLRAELEEISKSTIDLHIKAITDSGSCNMQFSYHPPQTQAWSFSSPTRVFRSLTVDGSIPVLDAFHGQHPIERCAITKDELKTFLNHYRSPMPLIIELLKNRVKAYNTEAKFLNDIMIYFILDGKN